jgi:hypothetical protein
METVQPRALRRRGTSDAFPNIKYKEVQQMAAPAISFTIPEMRLRFDRDGLESIEVFAVNQTERHNAMRALLGLSSELERLEKAVKVL